ncbi:DUF4286 family protein [Ferruginibacter sp. HRS2-29]|uniref:DUF4286 family protein n=1 Tax=Ferruginibacter sp. HRS2-29 TaxID=2487334 RepID=UPI0020CE2ABD|nr:DUF4286 family protein [Ferruginibacter sp. HRS2-29]MCP9752104.1 DUF4286 family protein [Ferruginibacter sp. HRS2-29]
MIVYNITTKVSHTIHAAWLKWTQEEHIPALIATGCFTEGKILQLLEVDDSEGPTFAVQMMAESKALYNRYVEQYAAALKQESFAKWGDQFISFRSVMKVVN